MSDYQTIEAVGETLRKLLWENIRSDARIHPDIIGSENNITADSPANLQANDTTRLSVYLYRITENSFMKNNEMLINTTNPKKKGRIPMTLDLFFLITPNTENETNNHLLIGKVMQIFYDNTVVRGSLLRGTSLEGTAEELRLVFYSLPLEETIQLWQSFSQETFKLSICYQVTPIKIDSTLDVEIQRVVEKEAKYYQKTKAEKGRRGHHA
jgi:hypothetical protein